VRFTRRKVILGVLTLLGVEPASPRGPGWHGQAAVPGEAEAAAARLSSAERENLVALAEVLVVEGRPLAPEERTALLDHLAERAEETSGYYRDLYRTTARLLDRLAGVRFASLTPQRRRALLSRYRLTSATVLPGEALGPYPDDVRAVRTRAVPDLIGGYYGSAVGWATVGYTAFPGRCGDLARYTRPEP
jgi:hypothetical protein